MAKQIQIIPKNLVFPVARVLDKEDREFYQEIQAKTAEKYGKDSLAYRTITNEIDTENVTGSQFFWNNNLGLYLSKNQRVISLEDMETINNLDETFFRDFYLDAPEIVLRTENLSYDKNKYILENLVKQVRGEKQEFDSENPLRISGLELVKDENSRNAYGLLLQVGQNTKMINDKRFANSNNRKLIPFGEKQKTIYTKENDLSGVFVYGDGSLNSDGDGLAVSGGGGRVVVFDAEGIAKNFSSDKYVKEIQEAYNQKIASVTSIIDKALSDLAKL